MQAGHGVHSLRLFSARLPFFPSVLVVSFHNMHIVLSVAVHLAEEEKELQGLAALLPGRKREKRVNIRERMASILMQARVILMFCLCKSRS